MPDCTPVTENEDMVYVNFDIEVWPLKNYSPDNKYSK